MSQISKERTMLLVFVFFPVIRDITQLLFSLSKMPSIFQNTGDLAVFNWIVSHPF